jgi:uncharacterized protein (TIGR00730 family)
VSVQLSNPPSIGVFCGSSSGFDPAYRAAAVELGAALAGGGHRLVYGGGDVGLMGVVANTVLGHGGTVTGVITEQLHALEVGHTGITELEVVADMHSRKARMAELSDGVVVLPGGFGTLDETFEILTWNQLGLLSTPVVFLDVKAYFQPVFDLIERGVSGGFLKPHHGAVAQRAATAVEAVTLACSPAPPYEPKWVD